MNNDNNSIDRFNFGRLAFLLKKGLITRRRSLLLQLLLVVGAMSILNIFIALGSPEEGEANAPLVTSDLSAVSAFVFFLSLGIYIMVGASLSFSDLGNKADRVLTLMEPATQLERFISRALPGILIPPLYVCFGQFIAEAVRVGVSEALYSTDYLYHPYSFMGTMGGIMGADTWMFMTFIFSSIGLSQSFYLLGSVVWPRLSFIKTFAACQAISSTLGIILMIMVSTAYMGFGSLEPRTVLHLANAFTILISIATVCIAYWRYREIEVIQRW